MKKATKFYYRSKSIVPSYIAILGLGIILLWSPFSSKYLGFLEKSPGVFVVYLCVAVYALVLVWKLPTFLRSLARVPAVEFDGETLLVRGWENRSFIIRPGNDLSVRDDGNGRIIISSPGEKSAGIYLRHVDGRESLVSFLKGLRE